jgi:hypothetical protein
VVPPRAKPKPPPPPPWVTVIGRPLPRPPQGVGLVPAPPTVDPTGPLTRIFDLTGKYLESVTQVTGVLVGIAHEIISTIQDFSDVMSDPADDKGEVEEDLPENEDECFASTKDTVANDAAQQINFSGPGAYPGKRRGWPAMRATGGTACIGALNGDKRKRPQTPVGYISGQHDRSHLIGHQFGGSNKRINIVPLDKEVNETDMLGIENEVAKAIANGNRVYYRVVANYAKPDDAVPVSITIHARGSQGFQCDVVIRNPHPAKGYPGGKLNGTRPAC